jgi:hypothetical protein
MASEGAISGFINSASRSCADVIAAYQNSDKREATDRHTDLQTSLSFGAKELPLCHFFLSSFKFLCTPDEFCLPKFQSLLALADLECM